MTPAQKLYATGGVVIVLTWAGVCFASHERTIGAVRQLVRGDDSALVAHAPIEAKIITRYVKDTTSLRALLKVRDSAGVMATALDSARTALARAAVTPRAIPETVTIRVSARAIVADDGALKICRLTVSDCQKGWALAKQDNALLTDENRRLKMLIPSTAAKNTRAVIIASVVLAVTEIARHTFTGKW